MSGGYAAIFRVLVDTNAGPAERKLSKFEKRLAGTHAAAKKFSHGVDLAGLALAGGITYGLVKAASAGVKFERQLSTLGAVSNASGKEMKRLENQALTLGESTLFTAKQVAEAQTELAKGGLNTKQILGGGTKAALALAAAGQLELAEAAETTVNAMKLFGIEAKDAESVADGYATAANRTTADVSDFAAAMKQGGAAVKAAGGNFNTGLTILEALAETGVKNSDAGTSMKTALVQLAAPTKKQSALQKELNLHFFDQNGNLKKATGLSDELRKALKNREGQERLNIAKTLAGTDGFRTLLALYEQGPKALAKLEKANKKQGTAQSVAAKQMDNFQGELEQLQGAAETLGIRIFKVMKPALEEAVKWAQVLTKEVSAIFADETLSGPEKFQKAFGLVFDKLIPLFEEAMTQTSEVAAENAPKAAGAFVKGWLNAGPWAKLFSAAYLYGKFGGVFGGLGRRAGTDMGKGMATGGGLSGALSKGMRIAGAAAAGYFVAEFGTQVIEKISGSDILEGQSLAASLTHGFNTKGVARTEQDHLQKAEGLNFTKSKAQLESLQAHFAATLHKIETDAAVGVGGIDKALATGLSQANETWLHGSKQWREHTVEAMRGAVGSIKEGMDAGFIKTKEGQRAINGLLAKIHLTTGKDPFGVAKASADSFKEGNAITQQGVREWVGKLDQMPKGAREKSREAMRQMLQAWAQGHPKLEDQVKSLTDFETQKFGAANKQLRADTNKTMKSLGRSMLNQLPTFHNFVETGGAAFTNLSSVAAEAMENIGNNVSSTLKTLHGPAANFTVKYLKEHGDGSGKKYLNQVAPLKKQRGGPINLGAPSGDTVPAMLERGEYVLNRRAVAAVGKHQLDAVNFGAAPRFQKGGLAEPHLAGPAGALLDTGQSAIHTVYSAAAALLAKERKKVDALGSGTASGSVANHPELQPGISAIVATILKKWPGLGISSTTGGGHAENSYHYMGRAADLAGSIPYMLQAAAWIKSNLGGNLTEGIHNPNLSVKYGKEVSSGYWGPEVWADHVDHIHVAKQLGGLVQKLQSGGAVVKTVGSILARNGLDLVSSAGILGNAYGESAWNTEAMEPGTHNGGLWGFTTSPVSLSDLEAFASSQGKPWGSAEVQTQFMLHHLDSGLRNKMNAASTTDSTTSLFMHEWERPENYSSLGKRQEAAHSALKMLEGAGIKGPTKAQETAHTYKEDVPAEWHGVKAGQSIKFPGIPKRLEAISAEKRKRQSELARYRRVADLAKSKNLPAIAQAIQQNITALEGRIRELHHALSKARLEAAQKKITRHLGKSLGKLTGAEKGIELTEGVFNEHQEIAEHIVGLEPEMPEWPASMSNVAKAFKEQQFNEQFTGYINKQEKPAYEGLMGIANDWRNQILRAEHVAAGDWAAKGPLGGMEGNWETKIFQTMSEAGQTEALEAKAKAESKKAQGDLSDFREKHGSKAELPDWLKDELKQSKALTKKAEKESERLPVLNFREKELRNFLGQAQEEFYPGGSRISERPTPPNQGTGTLEGMLENLQGRRWPGLHEMMGRLPSKQDAHGFGGIIWGLQEQLKELHLKLPGAVELGESEFGGEGAGGEGGSFIGEGSQGNSFNFGFLEGWDEKVQGWQEEAQRSQEVAQKSAEYWEEQTRTGNQRNAVFTRQKPIIDAYVAKNFAGMFAKGGSIPTNMWGIAGEAGPEIVRGPATVISNSDSAAMGGASLGGLHVSVTNHRDGSTSVDAALNGRQVEEVKKTINQNSRDKGRRARTIGARGAGRLS